MLVLECKPKLDLTLNVNDLPVKCVMRQKYVWKDVWTDLTLMSFRIYIF